MIKIILPAHLIPDRRFVKKPTGDKVYCLHRKFPVFGLIDTKAVQLKFETDDYLFLACDSGINLLHKESPLKMEFHNTEDAICFLSHLEE